MTTSFKLSTFSFISIIILLSLNACTKDKETPYVIEQSTVTDIEGTVYKTVKIGDQWWMAENLRVKSYNDGVPIEFIPVVNGSDTIWANTDSGAYCIINEDLFGCLYNAQVLENGKNIAPSGWHVPTDEDWKVLEKTLGMSDSEINSTGWRGSLEANLLTSQYNIGWPAGDRENGLFGTDYFGFNAKPSSIRGHDGRTNNQSNSAWWWSQTEDANGKFCYRSIDIYHRSIFRQYMLPECGLSIRCVKD
jgi:uncharacterized protein (TIGR02145 family)